MTLFNKMSIAIICILSLSSCGKLQRIMDGTENLPNQIEETNRGMRATNEAIRLQKIGVALSEMQKKQNREYLTPIPGDMMPAGKILAEALTTEEALLFMKDYIKKINEEYFENRYPALDKSSDQGQKVLADFEHDKLADLMMITIVAGYLPQSTLDQMIASESEQGAYRDILYQTLMLRVIFHNDLMLNASVLNEKLETLGKINKAIEYNSHVEYVSRLSCRDQVELKITGFTNPDMNAAISRKLNSTEALKNWNRIASAAQKDFKATSFSTNESDKAASIQKQNSEYQSLLKSIDQYIQAWAKDGVSLN